MDADIDIFGEYLANLLQTSIGSGDTTVDYAYEFTEELGTFTGRLITILPMAYKKDVPEDRSEDRYDLVYAIVIRERYSEPASPTKSAPTAWIKERIAFVEQEVFNLISDSRRPFYDVGSTPEQYWNQEAEVTQVYNFERLKQDKVFWSEIAVTYRKLKV